MHLILIEELIAELGQQEVPGVGVADVHGLLEDIAQTARKHDSSPLLLLAGEGFLEGLDVGQSASVVASSEADCHAHADGVVVALVVVRIAQVISEVGLVYLNGDGFVLFYDLEGHSFEYLLDVLFQSSDSWLSERIVMDQSIKNVIT